MIRFKAILVQCLLLLLSVMKLEETKSNENHRFDYLLKDIYNIEKFNLDEFKIQTGKLLKNFIFITFFMKIIKLF